MTAVATLLAGIRATSDGLTDLCPEYLRQGIRHLQRNCDIDCNVHNDETTWDDCKQPDRYDGDRMARALASVPRLIQALEGVLALADESDIHDQDYGERLASGHVSTDAIRTAITTALGDVEKPFTGFPPTPQHKNKVG